MDARERERSAGAGRRRRMTKRIGVRVRDESGGAINNTLSTKLTENEIFQRWVTFVRRERRMRGRKEGMLFLGSGLYNFIIEGKLCNFESISITG